MRTLGLILVVLGVLAVAYGGFWYTKEEKAAEIGPLEVRIESKERVNVPLWVGVGAAITGVVMVLTAKRGA